MHGLPKFHVSCRASFSLMRVSLSLHGHSLSETGCSDAVTFNNSLGYLAQNASHWDSHTATWQYKPIPRVDVREYAHHTVSDVVCHMTVKIRTGWYLSPPPRQCVYWPFALPWWYFNTYVKYWRFRNLIDATNQLFYAHSGRIEWWVEFTSASRHTRTHLFAGPMHTSTTLNVSSPLSCWLENALWDETLSPVLFIYQTPGSSHKSDTH